MIVQMKLMMDSQPQQTDIANTLLDLFLSAAFEYTTT